jgi:hypothetical protein
MPQHQSGWRRGAPADHVLVTAADIGGDDFQNDAVLALPGTQRKLRIIDTVDFDNARFNIDYTPITSHRITSYFITVNE